MERMDTRFHLSRSRSAKSNISIWLEKQYHSTQLRIELQHLRNCVYPDTSPFLHTAAYPEQTPLSDKGHYTLYNVIRPQGLRSFSHKSISDIVWGGLGCSKHSRSSQRGSVGLSSRFYAGHSNSSSPSSASHGFMAHTFWEWWQSHGATIFESL